MSGELDLAVYEVAPRAVWPYFAPHHYMSDSLPSNVRSWVAIVDDNPVGFVAVAPMPGPIPGARRESRVVILPDYQGLGIGVRLSEWAAEYVTWNFGAYYSRTVHPRLGEYRERSKAWIPTSMNKKRAGDGSTTGAYKALQRVAYSHRYIGYPEVAS